MPQSRTPSSHPPYLSVCSLFLHTLSSISTSPSTSLTLRLRTHSFLIVASQDISAVALACCLRGPVIHLICTSSSVIYTSSTIHRLSPPGSLHIIHVNYISTKLHSTLNIEMHFFAIVSTVLSLLAIINAQNNPSSSNSTSPNYGLNPSSVDIGTRQYWCQQQQAQCPLICADINNNDQTTIQNSCDAVCLPLLLTNILPPSTSTDKPL